MPDLQTNSPSFEDTLSRLRHDLEKPHAVVRMFLDLLPEIQNQPEEMARWKSLIHMAFDRAQERLDEFQRTFESRSR